MSQFSNLLESKLKIPHLPTQMVTRPRLFNALDNTLQPFQRMTLISAPTGYGKTSLVSAWIQARKLPAAWLTLEEQDNDPARFTSYLLAALEKANPEFKAPELLTGPYTGAELESSTLIPLLNLIAGAERTVLIVLDDYHCIKNQSVHHIVGYLLENMPFSAHLFLLTRADPPLPIARLRGRGQLNELRMEDLRFNPEETRSFLEGYKDLRLNGNEIKILNRRTEGWIAGLQMAAVSLQGHSNQQAVIEDFSGDHHYIMDFLLDEVLRQQPPEIQRFLLYTSILNRLNGSLCDALLAGLEPRLPASKDVLQGLEQANLFIIRLDEKREWFRYHRLFTDLLQGRLQSREADTIGMLHKRASSWFESQNLYDEAIQHAFMSEDTGLAADLVERVSQDLLMRSETATLLQWLQRLPREQITSRPRLAAYQAWALLFQGAPLSVVEAQLIQADQSQHQDPPGAAALLEAFVALSQGKVALGLDRSEYALEVLPPDEHYLRDFATFCVAGARIAAGELESGIQLLEDTTKLVERARNPSSAVIFLTELAEMRWKDMQLDEAIAFYQRALAAGTDESGKKLPIAGRALIGLGNLALERYDLEQAESLLQEGIQLTERWSLIGTLEAHVFMVMLHFARGAREKIEQEFRLLYDLARRFDASQIDDHVVEMVEADINVRQGDLEAAHAWVAKRGLDQAPSKLPQVYTEDYLTSRLYKYELPILIRLFIAEKRYEQADQAIEQLILQSKEANRPFLLLEAEILRASLLQARSNTDASLAALRRALEMARPSGSARLFLAEGDHLLKLLRKGRSAWDSPELLQFVDFLLRKFDPRSVIDPSKLDTLSQRELEVLQHLPSDKTLEAVAEELIISVNTVRSHVKSIYAKLEVHSRLQAVEKARHLNLL